MLAEEQQAPMGFNVNVYEIAPGTAPMFEEAAMKFKAAVDKLEGIPPYFGFSTEIGDINTYNFASGFSSFGDLASQRNFFT